MHGEDIASTPQSPFDRRALLAGLGLVGAAALARGVRAGPLNPPPGEIEPTGRTTEEVWNKIARGDAGCSEPRLPLNALTGNSTAVHAVTQPGSYYLTGDIQGQPGKNAVEIAASNVTIDLNGFAILGTGGSVAAIVPSGSANGAIVRNGVISSWPGGGVLVGQCSRVERVSIADCSGAAVAAGAFSIIEDCVARGGAGVGFSLSQGVIRRCTAEGGSVGIQVSDDSRVEACLALGASLVCIELLGEGCVASGCRSRGAPIGIRAAGDGGFVEDCSVFDTDTGIAVSGSRNVIRRNTVQSSQVGVYIVSVGNFLISSSVFGAQTPYQVNASNPLGPIVNIASANSIGGIFNANHPYVNFIH